MSRRSPRLATNDYYQHNDDTSSSSSGSAKSGAPSYKETPVRLHKKRSNSKGPGPVPGVKGSPSNSSVNSLSSYFSNISNASKRSQHLGSCSGWQEPVAPSTSSNIYLSSTSGYSSQDELQGLAYSESFSPLANLWGWISLLSPEKALPLVYWWLGTALYQLTMAISLIDVFTPFRYVIRGSTDSLPPPGQLKQSHPSLLPPPSPPHLCTEHTLPQDTQSH
ncbi:SUN domain-containing protein 2-like isoform X3 [Leucoraja erinacea]|uniref:SUN domain-containing protein 2-like isoform X3 n=1 Tax=Leucoraja erinaceus TaxID=7782 RepID=UPI0024546DB5|nr:SUN domain-containing protein 2-like isoform X3 [Leucoraja erinacea]